MNKLFIKNNFDYEEDDFYEDVDDEDECDDEEDDWEQI